MDSNTDIANIIDSLEGLGITTYTNRYKSKFSPTNEAIDKEVRETIRNYRTGDGGRILHMSGEDYSTSSLLTCKGNLFISLDDNSSMMFNHTIDWNSIELGVNYKFAIKVYPLDYIDTSHLFVINGVTPKKLIKSDFHYLPYIAVKILEELNISPSKETWEKIKENV